MKEITPKFLDQVLNGIYSSNCNDSKCLAELLEVDKDTLMKAITLIETDEYINVDYWEGVPFCYLSIKSQGLKFLHQGGYSEVERLKKMKEDEANSIIKTNQSVESTN